MKKSIEKTINANFELVYVFYFLSKDIDNWCLSTNNLIKIKNFIKLSKNFDKNKSFNNLSVNLINVEKFNQLLNHFQSHLFCHLQSGGKVF